jgi:hypothetical protein
MRKDSKKGKTYEEFYGIERAKQIKNKNSIAHVGKIKKPMSIEQKQKISLSMKGKNNWKTSNRGKKGWYKGYWCDSSWELIYVIYCLEHDIKIVKNTKQFKYNHNGVTKRWQPDFFNFKDNCYVEIKGYETEKDLCKYKGFKESLIVLYKKEIDIFKKYVLEKYGKYFINFYENKESKKIKTVEEINKKRREDGYNRQKIKIELIKNSNINFNKKGWIQEVVNLTKLRRQYVKIFMKLYLPEIFEGAYKFEKSNNKKRTIKDKTEYWNNIWNERTDIVRNSNINFNKLGWVKEVSSLLKMDHSEVNRFMKKYLPEICENAYRKNKKHKQLNMF